MSTAATHTHIVKTPGTCGGRPRIDGHRIPRQFALVDFVIKLRFIVGETAGMPKTIEAVNAFMAG